MLHERQEAEHKRIQAFVDRFRAKASKARQAQSRLKMLERMQPIAAVAETEGPVFRFPAPQPLPPPLATLAGVAVGYDAAAPVLRHLDLRLEEHTSELQSLMRNTYAVFCLDKKRQAHRDI